MYSYVYMYSRHNEDRDSTLLPVTPIEGDDTGLSLFLSLYIYIQIYNMCTEYIYVYVCIYIFTS